MGRAANGQIRTIRIADVTISIPNDLVILSVKITTEYRQVIVEFDGLTQPTESE